MHGEGRERSRAGVVAYIYPLNSYFTFGVVITIAYPQIITDTS